MILSRFNALTDLLQSESDARQIRSFHGKVIAQNAKGRSVFSNAQDPFSFFESTFQTEHLEKLKNAYHKKAPVQVQLELPQAIYNVTIRPLSMGMLLIAEDVSSIVQMQNLIQQEQSLLTDSLDAAGAGFYLVDSTGLILHKNARFNAWLELDPKKEICLYDLVKTKISLSSDSWTGDVDFLTPTHIFHATVFQTSIERDGQTFFVGIVLPKTSRKKELVASDSLFFEKAPFGIMIIDGVTLAIDKVNPIAEKFLTQIGDIKHQSLMNLLDDESQDALPLKLSKLMMRAQKIEKCELSFKLQNNETRPFMAYISPIEKDGEITEFIFYLTNLDERKTLQMQTLHAQKMQAMGQLAGGVAHDFNNLLTAIIGFSDLLLQRHSQGDPSFSDIMQIKNNANRASGLVGRLLTFSKKQPLKPRLLDISDEFSDLASLLRRSIGMNVELITDFAPDLGFVKVDPQQLMQVFLNLAVNARDAMPNGGTLTIKSHTETLKKSRTLGTEIVIPGSYIVIDVSDTGCGIAKENLNRIFDPFFSTKEGVAGSGTGLGLSTVYGIITQADGYIHVKSTQGKGTTFTIYLPRFENGPQPQAQMHTIIPVALQRANVLLVEDEDAVRAFSSRVLKNKGFNVTECANAQEALDLLNKNENFDLLLTDMVMPGMDGETLCNLAKERYPSLRVILMSGYSEDFARHGKDENKNFSFLPKPFSLNQLVLKVREVLQTKN